MRREDRLEPTHALPPLLKRHGWQRAKAPQVNAQVLPDVVLRVNRAFGERWRGLP